MLVAAQAGGMAISSMLIYVVFIFGVVYFFGIRPQQKDKNKHEQLLSTVAIGDTVLTTSGFNGVIIAMTDDTVIVEFGSDRHCRIPMLKQAIVQVEKPQ